MEVHAAGAAHIHPPLKAAANKDVPAVPASPAVGLTPQEVPLLMSQSALSQGQSLPDLPIVDVADGEQTVHTPRAILPAEIEKVLGAYNQHVRTALSQARQGSRLDQFETSLRLMANLQDPRLQQDKEAWDVLEMRHSQIEKEYHRLIQEPEVKAAFDKARQMALADVFGSELGLRTHQQAAYLLSDGFQHELDALPEKEIQPRIQQELSALAVLSPRQAQNVAEELIKRTLAHQSLKALQSDNSSAEIRDGLSQAIGLYLKAQQTALGVSVQAANLSRLVNLNDDQIKLLTDAISDLARDFQGKDPQQLALHLVSRVDELPDDLKANASSLIRHMQAQKVLGTILMAGSVAGLLRTDTPQDPKAWASLTTGVLGTATMAHHPLRLLGLNGAADIANKLNASVAIGSAKIPVVGSLITGVNTTLDAMALVEEVKNEDIAGTASRALGVGSGLASLAASTMLKGKAVPITLIATTLTGLSAWGIDSLWGESDLTGKIRRDLRSLGLSAKEGASLDKLAEGPLPADASLDQRLITINALMDQRTDSDEETQIFDILMRTPDEDFMPLIRQLHSGRLMGELENAGELRAVLSRIARLTKPAEIATGPAGTPAPGNDKLMAAIVQGLAQEHRFEELDFFLSKASAAIRQTLPSSAMQQSIDALLKGWTSGQEARAITRLLTDEGLRPAADAVLAKGGEKLIQRLRSELDSKDFGQVLGHMLKGSDPAVKTLAGSLFQRSAGNRLPTLTRLGTDDEAIRLTLQILGPMSPEQIKALPDETRMHMARLLRSQAQALWLMEHLDPPRP